MTQPGTNMLLNDDFSRRAVVKPDQHRWVPSPLPGVQRVMLDRLGGERGRATSLVRYAPGSSFSAHGHPGGEEILVLSGTFSDESGDYGPGWYLRNPPGSAHRPSSAEGARIFVKLWQMPGTEARTVRMDTRDPRAWQPGDGHDRCTLHLGDSERVCLLKLQPGASHAPETAGGAELLVLEGRLAEGDDAFDAGSWLRLPPGDATRFTAGRAGATVYLKTGHLAALVR